MFAFAKQIAQIHGPSATRLLTGAAPGGPMSIHRSNRTWAHSKQKGVALLLLIALADYAACFRSKETGEVLKCLVEAHRTLSRIQNESHPASQGSWPCSVFRILCPVFCLPYSVFCILFPVF